MKNINKLKMGSRLAWSRYYLNVKSAILLVFIVTGISSTTFAQTTQDSLDGKRPQPKFWFGISGAGNFNNYTGTTQTLNSEFKVPTAFHKGQGIKPYGSLFLEYRPDAVWGFMFNIGYDGRGGKFDQVEAPCNCPADLATNLTYVTAEPSLRIAPFSNGLYVFVGPTINYNIDKSFNYTQVLQDNTNGDFSETRQVVVSGQIGAGYDIPLSSKKSNTQVNLSPFVSYHPYFNQEPRSIESWSLSTLRVGLALKFGHVAKTYKEEVASIDNSKKEKVVVAPIILANADVTFTVVSPLNIPLERRVRETFPLRNYVFFNLGSTEIPDRYILLTKDQVKDFKEDQLEVLTPKRLTGRSNREMIVYYNLLNILGDRMGKNPSSTITLVGSSEKGPEDGKKMSESIQKYLGDVFGINASRIAIEGRDKPKIPSEQLGGTLELPLLREGDRRVTIESTSPALLMEFRTGPNAPLKPVEINAVQDAPLDSYVSFIVKDSSEILSSWSLELKDEKGILQKYGTYTQEKVSIPGKTILVTREKGDFSVIMIGERKTGGQIMKYDSVHMYLWKPAVDEQGMRFSIIYEFNKSEAIAIYEKYLTEIVTPKIPKGATVILHGYTDIIGDANNNLKLSVARANDVKGIFVASLAKTGRTDVKFETYGFGEDEKLSPFENNFPEERFYNRTVIIDIIPKK